MQQTDFSKHRVLLVGAKSHPLLLLRSVMGIVGVGNVIHVETDHRALEVLGIEHFHTVFCDDRLKQTGDKPFVLAARRNESMLNPMIPIFAFRERARRRDVETARDLGATDVLTLPISPMTLAAKLQLATHSPRTFIVGTEYFGPDRRAKARPAYYGAERRKRVSKKAKMDLTLI
jgi:two-component system chemotaxis response regulator CheY